MNLVLDSNSSSATYLENLFEGDTRSASTDIVFPSSRYRLQLSNASNATSVALVPINEVSPNYAIVSDLLKRANVLARRILDPGEIAPSSTTIDRFAGLMRNLWDASASESAHILGVAFLTATGSGELQIEWEDGDHYLEIVVSENSKYEFLIDTNGRTREGTFNIDDAVRLILRERGKSAWHSILSQAMDSTVDSIPTCISPVIQRSEFAFPLQHSRVQENRTEDTRIQLIGTV